jgi:hypothetical protein
MWLLGVIPGVVYPVAQKSLVTYGYDLVIEGNLLHLRVNWMSNATY